MNDRDILRQQRLERIQVFGNENATEWPADSAAAESFEKIDQHLVNLAAARTGQKRTPVSKQTLLDGLWLDFRNIARTARSIDLDEPGFAAAYRLPDNPTEKSIKDHADSLLKIIEDDNAPVSKGGDTTAQKTAKAALRAKFTRKFTPDDFVAHLRADRDAIDAKNNARTAGNLSGLESTGEIETVLEAASQDCIRLDAMMQNLYARNPAKLRAWLAASRIERAAQREKKPDAPAAAPAPQPALA